MAELYEQGANPNVEHRVREAHHAKNNLSKKDLAKEKSVVKVMYTKYCADSLEILPETQVVPVHFGWAARHRAFLVPRPAFGLWVRAVCAAATPPHFRLLV